MTDGTLIGAVIGLMVSVVLAVLGMLGRRYESRESRAVTTQAAVIDDLEMSNTRLRAERDEAREALTAEVAHRRKVEQRLAELERDAGIPHRRRFDRETS